MAQTALRADVWIECPFSAGKCTENDACLLCPPLKRLPIFEPWSSVDCRLSRCVWSVPRCVRVCSQRVVSGGVVSGDGTLERRCARYPKARRVCCRPRTRTERRWPKGSTSWVGADRIDRLQVRSAVTAKDTAVAAAEAHASSIIFATLGPAPAVAHRSVYQTSSWKL